MRPLIVLGLALFFLGEARHLYKRNNQYGDELAPPAPAAAEPAPAPVEQAPAAVEQAAAAPEAAPEVQASGYRRKRNNQYGDELAPPAPAPAEPAPAPVEEAPAAVEQAAAAPEAAPEVQASGYRRKRNNQYGDELAPPAPAPAEPAPAPVEEAPAAVEQAAAAPEAAPEVQASGYRRKRNNQYGDELAPPAPAPAEPAPAPVEQAPAAVEQAAAAPEAAPEVQASGYRRKRNNQYGDELAPPAPAPAEPAPAPVEQAPAAVEQAAAAPEAAPEVQASGYRRKRNNQYGDELAPPAPAPAEPAPAPVEEAPAAIEQAAAAPEAAPEVQASGY